MTSISNLPLVGTSDTPLTGSEQFPAAGGQGYDVRVPMAALIAYFRSAFTSPEFTVSAQTPGDGFGISIGSTSANVWLILRPTGAITTGTITLPPVASATDGQTILVTTTEGISTLTVVGNGATVVGAPSAVAANTSFSLRYNLEQETWFPTGASSSSFITVTISDAVLDVFGNEVLSFQLDANAVNHVQITNASTGEAPEVAAVGDDANIDLVLAPKGTGVVKTSPNAGDEVVRLDATQTITQKTIEASAINGCNLGVPAIGAGTLAALDAARLNFGLDLGTRGTQTDASVTTFNSLAAAGGANVVPIFHDGTNWRVG